MTPGCARTRAVAAELALGIAEGDQRADALDHLVACASCRAELDHLAATADSLLLVAPVAEPPAGFETSVLDRLDRLDPPVPGSPPATARSRFVRASALAAAAVVVLVVGVAIGRAWVGRVPAEDGGGALARGALTVASGAPVGEVTALTGDPSLLVVTVAGTDAASLPAGDYRVECVYGRGYTYDAGVMHVAPDVPVSAWSRSLDFRIDDLTQVRLIGADGTDVVADVAPR